MKNEECDDTILLHMIPMKVNNVDAVMFFDDGSTHSMITHNFARKLKANGEMIVQEVETLGMVVEKQTTMLYKVNLLDMDGVEHKVDMVGMDKIASGIGNVNVDEAYQVFSEIGLKLPPGSLERPSGAVDILLGQNVAYLMPGIDGIWCKGNLRVLRTKFGTGYVLGGSNPKIKSEPVQLCNAASFVMRNGVKRKVKCEAIKSEVYGVYNEPTAMAETFQPQIEAGLETESSNPVIEAVENEDAGNMKATKEVMNQDSILLIKLSDSRILE